jgi:hypothetical protein
MFKYNLTNYYPNSYENSFLKNVASCVPTLCQKRRRARPPYALEKLYGFMRQSQASVALNYSFGFIILSNAHCNAPDRLYIAYSAPVASHATSL